MKFIDEVTLTVASGNGGPGCVSFRRESHVPRGGPDGGNGGKGGNVVVRVNSHLNSLLNLYSHRQFKASNGQPGQSEKMDGKSGNDLVIEVPVGTVITSESNQKILADLGETNEVILLKGGLGGKGNTFYKSAVNQAPGIAQKGIPGEEKTVHLELKLLADVGIIGFPSAGKSTLISVISAAKPKIAEYPFTTLVPNLGVIRYGEGRSFVAADIPGLIAGAHKGVGLGVQFLRHIERTRVFIHLIDACEMTLRNPIQDYLDINEELKQYDQINLHKEGYFPLNNRPQVVALNKVELISKKRLQSLEAKFNELGIKPLMISAATHKNINELVYAVGKYVFNEGGDE